MKIGILTFHRAINYGAVLQCYALYCTLSDMGHDVEVIDYRPSYIEKYRKLLVFSFTWNIFAALKALFRDIFLYKKRRDAVRNFDDFLNLMKISPVVRSEKEIATQEYDFILSGSDQVWNPRITGGRWDKFYWGQFKHTGAKFASYAASFGGLPTKEMSDDIKKMLQKVDGISVRENNMADYLRNLGLKVNVCVDPTILVDENIFMGLAQEPVESNYILVYALKDRVKAVNWAKKIQKKTNMEIIVLGGNISGKTNYGEGVRMVQGLSPRQFLGYFKKADYVVNASFHGTVFSTLFRKNFYSLQCSNSGRYGQYLHNIDLDKRFVEYGDDPLLTPVDYSGFEEKRNRFVESSKKFLKNLGI